MKNGAKVLAIIAVVAMLGLRIGLAVMQNSERDSMPEPDWDAIGKIAAEDFMKNQRTEVDQQVARINAYFELQQRLAKQREHEAAQIWVQAQSAGIVSDRGTVYVVPQGPTQYDGTPHKYSKPQLEKPTAGRYLQVTRSSDGRIDDSFHNAKEAADNAAVTAPRPAAK